MQISYPFSPPTSPQNHTTPKKCKCPRHLLTDHLANPPFHSRFPSRIQFTSRRPRGRSARIPPLGRPSVKFVPRDRGCSEKKERAPFLAATRRCTWPACRRTSWNRGNDVTAGAQARPNRGLGKTLFRWRQARENLPSRYGAPAGRNANG